MRNLINWQKTHPVLSEPFMHQPPFLSSFLPSQLSSDIEKLNIHPSVDIFENEQMYKVEIEMPGVGQEDISVAIDNGILSITGKKEISKKDQGRNYLSREIGYGSYERDIALPSYVDIDKAKASFKKGMLWISFPKKMAAKKRQRELKIEEVK